MGDLAFETQAEVELVAAGTADDEAGIETLVALEFSGKDGRVGVCFVGNTAPAKSAM